VKPVKYNSTIVYNATYKQLFNFIYNCTIMSLLPFTGVDHDKVSVSLDENKPCIFDSYSLCMPVSLSL